MTYTDAQLVLLSAASQRDDGLLPRPAKLAGAALRNLEAALVKAGAAEPTAVRTDQPSWRSDETETPVGLRITRAGLKALGIEPAEQADGALQATLGDCEPVEGTAASPAPSAPASAPLRPGTKRALLVQHLSSAEGASLQSLATALAWQLHTVRAALTRLRQDGFTIVLLKDEQNRTTYRIAAPGPQSEPAEAARDDSGVA